MSKVVIGTHARERMEEHAISRAAVIKAVLSPVEGPHPDDRRGHCMVVWGSRIGVVYDPTRFEGGVFVVTVKPSREAYNHPNEPDLRFTAVQRMATASERARRPKWTEAEARAMKGQGYSDAQVERITGYAV